MFDKMKGMMEMQKMMQQVKRELENAIFEVSSSDGLVKITMNAAQEVKDVVLRTEPGTMEKRSLEKAILEAYNKGIKRAQQVAADKMREVTGFNLPGLT